MVSNTVASISLLSSSQTEMMTLAKTVSKVVGYNNQFDGPFYPQHPRPPPVPAPETEVESTQNLVLK